MLFNLVDKYEEMIGSYAPKTDIQMHDCTSEQAPAGFFARGTYKGKAIVLNFLFKKKWFSFSFLIMTESFTCNLNIFSRLTRNGEMKKKEK